MNIDFEIYTVQLETRGRVGICPLPGLGGDLRNDIDRIVEWNPSVVLSMTEQHEMDAGGCGQLGDLLIERGVDWVHLPVIDFGGLTGENLNRWPDLSKDLNDRLRRDDGILIHCRGGKGRSGMIAMRLLVEQGTAPETALHKLRQVRPGAVETDEQKQWAAG